MTQLAGAGAHSEDAMAKIHIVDDDADIRRLLSYHFIEEGHEVSVGRDGEEILETIANDQPDLLVLDLMMPKLDGRQVLERLRASDTTAAIPVFVLSGMSRSASNEWPGAHFVGKPFNPESLVRSIRGALGG